MNTVRYVLLLAVLTATHGAAPSVSADAREEFHETIPVEAGKRILITNVNGNIKVEAWDNNYVDLKAVKTTSKDRDELKRVSIVITDDVDLEIRTEYHKRTDDDDSFFNRMLRAVSHRSPSVRVDYLVMIPVNANLEQVKTVTGQVFVAGTSGDTYAAATNGKVYVENTRGLLEARNTNGPIHVAGVEGTISAKTTNGDIRIEDAADLSYARTTNGSIELSVTRFGNGEMNVSTTNGSIKLTISPEIDAYLDLKTTNGSFFASDFPVMLEKISRRHFTGKIGNGGSTISLKTTNGSIHLFKPE